MKLFKPKPPQLPILINPVTLTTLFRSWFETIFLYQDRVSELAKAVDKASRLNLQCTKMTLLRITHADHTDDEAQKSLMYHFLQQLQTTAAPGLFTKTNTPPAIYTKFGTTWACIGDGPYCYASIMFDNSKRDGNFAVNYAKKAIAKVAETTFSTRDVYITICTKTPMTPQVPGCNHPPPFMTAQFRNELAKIARYIPTAYTASPFEELISHLETRISTLEDELDQESI